MPSVPPRFIDGYNVIRRTPALATLDARALQLGRDRLKEWVKLWAKKHACQVYVVFDGNGDRESVSSFAFGCFEVYTRYDETADDLIRRRCHELREQGAEPVVITDDVVLQQHVREHGAHTSSASAFGQELNHPPRDVRKRGQHRMYQREQWRRESEK